jgi:hypothetical protein
MVLASTRMLLAVFVVLTLACGGVAIYYNRVFERLEVALVETKARLAAAQARLKEQQAELRAEQSRPVPGSSLKDRR